MKIINLSCEHMPADEKSYKAFPYCIDTERPVFGFAVEDEENRDIKFYKVIVASSLDKLNTKDADMWDSGVIYDNDTTCIRYEGASLESRTTYYFAVYVSFGKDKIKSRPGMFTTGLLLDSDWKCGFVGANSDILPKFECEEKDTNGLPAPYLRKSFTVHGGLVSAKAYATAFGIYEMYLNGEAAGEYKLAPEWTDYRKSLQYQYYDLTDKLLIGENVIGAAIGDGWFCGNISLVGKNQYGSSPLAFRMNLTLEYDDGSVDTVVTDPSWKCAVGGVMYSDNQNGEYFDAQKEPVGWNAPGFDDTEWANAITIMPMKCAHTNIKASVGPQVKENLTLSPIDIKFDKDGKVVVDMGQNMVGVASVKLHGMTPGTVLTIIHGEMLNTDGTVYTENLRTARQKDTYVCRGGEEEYHPRFTFHGFRYFAIDGLKTLPEKDDITGHVIYSACERLGYISTESELVNQLFSNALWGQMGNFVGVPTDCPQRDERLGWTGDTQVFCRSACYNMNCYGFYEKYLQDMRDSQKPNGMITDIVPMIAFNEGNANDLVGNGNAAWGDAAFIVPYTVYTMYGDIRIIAQQYESMARYFKALLGTTKDLIRPAAGYGDWLSIDDTTPLEVLSTAYFAYSAYIMAKCAKLLNRTYDYEYYLDMFEQIRNAWCEEFVDPDVIIKGDTQCCYLLALKMKLLREEDEERAAEHLVRTIRRKDYHLSTGFVGVSYLLPVLCDYGYSDIAYRLLLNDTYPSWGYSIKNGATTIWERWNSYTIEDGFGDIGMNSFNHYSLGSCVEWMYAYMGGIKPKKAGFGEFYVKPYFNDSVGKVNCEYNSASGKIRTEWEKCDDGYELSLTVPANTRAYLMFSPDDVTLIEGNKPKNRKNCLECCGGEYKFIIK